MIKPTTISKEGRPVWIAAGTPYTIYYDPFFKFDEEDVETDPEAILFVAEYKRQYMLQRIPKIIESIKKDGIITPAYLELRPKGVGRDILHPGQTRCRALRLMGRDTIPTLIIDLREGYEGDCEPIEAEYAMMLFNDDVSLTIKEDGSLRLRNVAAMFRGEVMDPNMSITYADDR